MIVLGSPLLDAPVVGAYRLVTELDSVLYPAFGPASTAIAIVLFTMAVRTAMLPFSVSQARAQRVRAALQPRVDELRREHREDPVRRQQEIAALYRAEGTSTFAGCLPALAQWPFFLVMYRLFVSASVAGQQNALLHAVFGHNLAALAGVYGFLAPQTLLCAGVLVALTGLAWLTSRWMRRNALLPGSAPAAVLRLMPYGTVVVAALLPFAAAIYLLTTTAWTAAERVLLQRGRVRPVG